MPWTNWFVMISWTTYLRRINIPLDWPTRPRRATLIQIYIWFISSPTRTVPIIIGEPRVDLEFSRAAITLHNPYIDFTDPNNVSTARCIMAARAILSAYYTLTATSLDITRLHPFVTVCFFPPSPERMWLTRFLRFAGTLLRWCRFNYVNISLKSTTVSENRQSGERLMCSGLYGFWRSLR